MWKNVRKYFIFFSFLVNSRYSGIPIVLCERKCVRDFFEFIKFPARLAQLAVHALIMLEMNEMAVSSPFEWDKANRDTHKHVKILHSLTAAYLHVEFSRGKNCECITIVAAAVVVADDGAACSRSTSSFYAACSTLCVCDKRWGYWKCEKFIIEVKLFTFAEYLMVRLALGNVVCRSRCCLYHCHYPKSLDLFPVFVCCTDTLSATVDKLFVCVGANRHYSFIFPFFSFDFFSRICTWNVNYVNIFINWNQRSCGFYELFPFYIFISYEHRDFSTLIWCSWDVEIVLILRTQSDVEFSA